MLSTVVITHWWHRALAGPFLDLAFMAAAPRRIPNAARWRFEPLTNLCRGHVASQGSYELSMREVASTKG